MPTALTTPRRYAVTYTFTHGLHASPPPLARIMDAVAAIQATGVAIEFRGATQEIDATGTVVAVTVRFEAPTKGAIGRLNCCGGLPAAGQPRLLESATTLSERRPLVALGH